MDRYSKTVSLERDRDREVHQQDGSQRWHRPSIHMAVVEDPRVLVSGNPVEVVQG
jgi:hypothetical protein